MKILNISLDASILKEGSRARKRHLGYARLLEELHILVLYPGKEQVVGNNIWIYSVCGNKFSRFFAAYQKAKRIIRNRQIEFISSQDPFFAGLIGWLLKRKFGLPLQIQVHTDFLSQYFWEESWTNRIRVSLARFLVRHADGIRVVSERIKRSLIRIGVDEGRILVMPIYSDNSEQIKVSNNRGGRENNKFIFLTIGRLSREKNIEMQIAAMSEIVKVHPRTELHIVGDGPMKKKLEAGVKNLELEEKIKFFGWQDNLAEFYRNADVFLLTSNYEGWGMVVVEAAACGLPIIMTDVGLAGEIIKNNENGLVVPVGGKNQLREAMLKLSENDNFRKELGQKAKQVAGKLPNREEYLQTYKKAFDLP